MAAVTAQAPAHLERYLVGTERLVVAVRRHPARLVEPVGSSAAGLVAAVWLDSELTGEIPVVADVVWLAWLALVVRALWKLAEWRQDWFVATDQRLLLTYGLVTRKVAMMPLSKVTDLSYNRSPLGRVLGYGEFVLESAGQDQAMRAVDWLPEPDVLYRRICAELFDPRRVTHPRVLGRPHVAAEPGPARRAGEAPVVREQVTEPVPGWTPQPPQPPTPPPGFELPDDGTQRPVSRWRRRR